MKTHIATDTNRISKFYIAYLAYDYVCNQTKPLYQSITKSFRSANY